MSELPGTIWIIAVAVIVLILAGAWMAVRVLRGRRPTPEIDHDQQGSQQSRQP